MPEDFKDNKKTAAPDMPDADSSQPAPTAPDAKNTPVSQGDKGIKQTGNFDDLRVNIGDTDQQRTISVAVGWQPTRLEGHDVRASAFILGADGRVRHNGDIVFYNQTESSQQEIRLDNTAQTVTDDLRIFHIELHRLDPSVQEIHFAINLSHADERDQTFANMKSSHIRVVDPGDQHELARHDEMLDGRDCTAVRLAKLVKSGGDWVFQSMGEGTTENLAQLADDYGLNYVKTAAEAEQSTTRAGQKPIVLEKEGQTVNRAPSEGGFGKMTVDLTWDQPDERAKRTGGLLGKILPKKKKQADFDIGALYELRDGSIGAVQSLGDVTGEIDEPPYIALASDDDRTGKTSGEQLVINGDHWSEISRILIYAFIYKGVANWAQANANVTISFEDDIPLSVQPSADREDRNMCAVAMLENNNGGLIVSRVHDYFPGHLEMDRAFGFGIAWEKEDKD